MFHSPLRIPARHPIADGLVLYIPFEPFCIDKAIDLSIYGNHGTIYGASWVDGKYGKALSFDGVDDYVSIPYSPSIDLSSFTVAAWVKLVNVTDFHCVIGNRMREYTFDFKFRSLGLHGNIGDGTGWLINWADYYFTPALDTWYHVCYAVMSGGSCSIYLNGEHKITHNFNGTPRFLLPGASMMLGQTGFGDEWFNGLIDEVYVFNRALSQSEIMRLYEAGRPWRLM